MADPIDYSALAAKFGGTSAPAVDYNKLAAQFGARQPDAIDQAAADPTSGMSKPEQALAGIGQKMNYLWSGIKERLGMMTPEDIDALRKLDAPLLRPSPGALPPIQGGSLGVRPMERGERNAMGPGGLGSAAAEVGLIAPAAAIPGVNTVLGGAALGAATGFIQPTGTGESVLKNTLTGAATGGATNLAARVVPSAVDALTQPFYPSGRQRIVGAALDRFGVTDAPKAASTPGWQPTLAEATQNPGAAILERAAGTDPIVAQELARRGMANNGAAITALRDLAGTPADQKLAIATRDYMAGPLYDQAAAQGIDQGMAAALKPQIQNLMERPSMKLAASVAKNTFGEESINLARAGDVKGLQYMKQALDDIIEKASSPTSSIGSNQLRALQQTRSDLISTMQDIAPSLRAADQQYAIFSRPINESKVATALEGKLVPALQAGTDQPASVTASNFANSLRSLDDKIPQITGYPGSTVENTMSPGGMKTLEGIKSDLMRRSNAQSMGRGPGSNTAQNLAGQNLLQNIAGPLGMPQSWAAQLAASTVGRTVMGPAKFIYSIPDKAIQEELAHAVLDPNYAAMLRSKGPLLTGKTKMAAQILQLMAAPTALGVANAQKQ